jgi:uncharacterized protein
MYLTTGKFFTIFSFLFGLSFYLQHERASTPTRRFLWRLTILGLIGAVHTLFYSGDILIVYAIAGLALLITPRLTTRAIALMGLLLVFNFPIQLERLRTQLGFASPTSRLEESELLAQVNNYAWQDLRTKQSGSLPAILQWNLNTAFTFKAIFQLASGRLFITIGLFFLGVVAGRLRLFEDTPLHRQWLRRALTLSLPIGILTTWLTHRWNPTLLASAHDLYPCLGLVSFDIQQITLSVAYAAAFILLCWRAPASPWLHLFYRAGRMGLTVYLLQSLVGILIFYGIGFGMIGRYGLFAEVIAGLLATQLIFAFANLWMTYFRFGPVEYFWRITTSGKLDSLRA